MTTSTFPISLPRSKPTIFSFAPMKKLKTAPHGTVSPQMWSVKSIKGWFTRPQTCWQDFVAEHSRGSATARNIRGPDYELRHLHYTNWRLKICIWRLYFSSWSPKGDLTIFFNFEPCYCEKLIASLWQENSTRDLITELCTNVCLVVRSRGPDRVCRLNVDNRNFARIDVDEFFKCRTENIILKYEHVKRYTFKGVKN